MSERRLGQLRAIAVFLHTYNVATILIVLLSLLWLLSAVVPMEEIGFRTFPYEAMIAFVAACGALLLGEVAGRENIKQEAPDTEDPQSELNEPVECKETDRSHKLSTLDSSLASEYLSRWIHLRQPIIDRWFLEDFEVHHLYKLKRLRNWIEKNNSRFEDDALKKLSRDVRWQVDKLLEAGEWAFEELGSTVKVHPRPRPEFPYVTHDSILEGLLKACKDTERAGIAIEEYLRSTNVSWPSIENGEI